MGHSEFMVFPDTPTSDKILLVSLVGISMTGDIIDNDYYKSLKILKGFNNNQLKQFFDYNMKELWSYDIISFYKKSLKLCYGGGSFWGLSPIAMNEFITELRKSIHTYN